jgi:hypothetical protein
MLAHTIEAVVNDKITRTHCNTCGAQHAHRKHPPGTALARKRAGDKSPKTASRIVDYQALLRGRDVGSARPYKTSERFQAKELIHHPVFGVGVVIAVRDSNKLDVGFNDGLKVLIHGSSM